MNCVNCKNFEPLQTDSEPNPITELPPIMSQRFSILDCLLQVSSVAGDLYILESHPGEMSSELRADMEALTLRLKNFNKKFCEEY